MAGCHALWPRLSFFFFFEDTKLCVFFARSAPIGRGGGGRAGFDAHPFRRRTRRIGGEFYPYPTIIPAHRSGDREKHPLEDGRYLPWDGSAQVPEPLQRTAGGAQVVAYARANRVGYICSMVGTTASGATSRVETLRYGGACMAVQAVYWALGIPEGLSSSNASASPAGRPTRCCRPKGKPGLFCRFRWLQPDDPGGASGRMQCACTAHPTLHGPRGAIRSMSIVGARRHPIRSIRTSGSGVRLEQAQLRGVYPATTA